MTELQTYKIEKLQKKINKHLRKINKLTTKQIQLKNDTITEKKGNFD